MTRDDRGKRRALNRWAVLIAGAVLFAWLAGFVGWVAVELATERVLSHDFDLVIDEDRGDGTPTTIGEVLAQVDDAWGGILEIDYEALGVDEAAVKGRSAWMVPAPAIRVTMPRWPTRRMVYTIRPNDMLWGTMQSYVSPDAAVVIEGRTVVVTHKDRLGFDATAKARSLWKWITSR